MCKKLVKPLIVLGSATLQTLGAYVYTIMDYVTIDEFSKEA
ncbi:hypothetical protein [Bacillus sp. Xin]|nr:hypothetical protein [Bacillus sp. Xin]